MIELAELANEAINIAANYLNETTSNISQRASEASGAAIFTWIKSILKGKQETVAIKTFEDNPQSSGAAKVLAGLLELKLETHSGLASELEKLLLEHNSHFSLHQNSSTHGNQNASIQIAGNSNNVQLNKK